MALSKHTYERKILDLEKEIRELKFIRADLTAKLNHANEARRHLIEQNTRLLDKLDIRQKCRADAMERLRSWGTRTPQSETITIILDAMKALDWGDLHHKKITTGYGSNPEPNIEVAK